MKLLQGIAVFILFFCLFMSAFLIFSLKDPKTEEYKPIDLEGKTNTVYTNSTQFYPNMRYPDRRISFSISKDCREKKLSAIIDSFSILSEKTVLELYYVGDDGEIEVLCSNLSPRPEDSGHFVAGEGGPRDILETGLYYVILSGKISLYRDETCKEPKIAIHEILHSLGFDHNNNPRSIMYPVTNCDQEIDDYIIKEINELYSVDSMPDLTISKADVKKTGRYISFNLEVLNQGLRQARDVDLEVYADGEFVKSYSLDDIGIGIKKIIQVDNLRVSSETQEIKFFVSSQDADEISITNNQAILENIEE